MFFFSQIASVASTQPYLTHGPVTGNVDFNSATVFIRTNISSTVKLKYSTNSQFTTYLVSSAATTTLTDDFSTKINLDSLSPSTTYYLDVLVNDTPQLTTPYPYFKTFPSESESADLKIVHLTDFCCIRRYKLSPTNTFVNAGLENPDVVLIGGDFDHRNPSGTDQNDARVQKRDMFKDLYSPVTSTTFVNSILRHYPLAHMWDDHDYATNNSDKTYLYKSISLEVLNEFFPTYATSPYGDWQKFRIAQAEFFLLDSRSQRDPKKKPDNADKSMLDGDNLGVKGQLEWLKQGLLNSTATWKFIVSPVVFNPTTSKNDSWAGYLTERAQIVNFANQNNIKNILVISGDLHGGGIDNGNNSDFPEMLVPQSNLPSGTDISCFTALNIGKWSQGIYGSDTLSACQGYGVIEVLTNPDRVVLKVKDSNGESRLSYTVPFSP